MTLKTVQEYAILKDISPQAVYSLIKRNRVKHQLKNGIKMIEVESKQNDKLNSINCKPTLKLMRKEIKLYKKIIKDKDQQIESLKESMQIISAAYNIIKSLDKPIDAEIIEKKEKKKKKTK